MAIMRIMISGAEHVVLDPDNCMFRNTGGGGTIKFIPFAEQMKVDDLCTIHLGRVLKHLC